MNPHTHDINNRSQRSARSLEELLDRSSVAPLSPIAVRPQQAAEMIGVSERTLRELIRQGEIPIAKLNRAVLIQVSELQAFLDRRSQRGGTLS